MKKKRKKNRWVDEEVDESAVVEEAWDDEEDDDDDDEEVDDEVEESWDSDEEDDDEEEDEDDDEYEEASAPRRRVVARESRVRTEDRPARRADSRSEGRSDSRSERRVVEARRTKVAARPVRESDERAERRAKPAAAPKPKRAEAAPVQEAAADSVSTTEFRAIQNRLARRDAEALVTGRLQEAGLPMPSVRRIQAQLLGTVEAPVAVPLKEGELDTTVFGTRLSEIIEGERSYLTEIQEQHGVRIVGMGSSSQDAMNEATGEGSAQMLADANALLKESVQRLGFAEGVAEEFVKGRTVALSG